MNISQTLSVLKKSKFRSSFHLVSTEIEIINKKGMETIRKHALELLEKRIKIKPKNDGRQTPFKGHPVFVAQHATATCCRKCIQKWHFLPKDRPLTTEEISSLANLITIWIESDYANQKA